MKIWEKPKLIILVRGKPQESLLQVCKAAESFPGSPVNYDTGCHYECNYCDVNADS